MTRRADQILKEIEKEARIEPLSGKKARRSSRYTQLIFFDEPAAAGREELAIGLPQKKQAVLQEIKALNLDDLTPREALGRLADYQKMLSDRGEVEEDGNGQD